MERNNPESVGQRIRAKRHAARKTLAQVAKATGLNIATLSLVERDRLEPKVERHLRPLARALGTTVAGLLPDCDRRRSSNL